MELGEPPHEVQGFDVLSGPHKDGVDADLHTRIGRCGSLQEPLVELGVASTRCARSHCAILKAGPPVAGDNDRPVFGRATLQHPERLDHPVANTSAPYMNSKTTPPTSF